MSKYPQRGVSYTLLYIMTQLELRDSPFLMFRHEGRWITIQDSHCTDEEFLSNPAFANVQWTYQYETSEWCPIFHLTEGQSLDGLVTVEPSRDYFTGEIEPNEFWAIPTHCPRQQNFAADVKPV